MLGGPKSELMSAPAGGSNDTFTGLMLDKGASWSGVWSGSVSMEGGGPSAEHVIELLPDGSRDQVDDISWQTVHRSTGQCFAGRSRSIV